jgi:hypothetical protein
LQRGSDKHSPRVDEELEHETRSLEQGAPVESRVEEYREQEGPGDDQPTPSAVVNEPDSGSLDLDDAEARSDIARFIDPSAFPTDREGLIENAEANNAPPAVLDRLQALPGARTYQGLPDVWAALGGTVEHRF